MHSAAITMVIGPTDAINLLKGRSDMDLIVWPIVMVDGFARSEVCLWMAALPICAPVRYSRIPSRDDEKEREWVKKCNAVCP